MDSQVRDIPRAAASSLHNSIFTSVSQIQWFRIELSLDWCSILDDDVYRTVLENTPDWVSLS